MRWSVSVKRPDFLYDPGLLPTGLPGMWSRGRFVTADIDFYCNEIIVGLGEIYEDDHQLMEAGGKVFDALYERMKK